MSSTGALNLPDIPETLLVIGGGYVGLELGMVYAALGSRITLVELGDRLLPGVDRDLVAPLAKRLQTQFDTLHFNTRVSQLQDTGHQVTVTLAHERNPADLTVDRVLVAIGRRPNTEALGLESTGVQLDERGFIKVDHHQRTSLPHVYAVGDIVGGVMLAHKAMVEGKIAAEVIAGHKDVAECAVLGVDDQLKGQVPIGFLVLNAGVDRDPNEIIKEVIQMVRDRIGPVASFKTATVVKRLPKTRSGKILRGTIQKIADNKPFKTPATIDDPVILDEMEEMLILSDISVAITQRILSRVRKRINFSLTTLALISGMFF